MNQLRLKVSFPSSFPTIVQALTTLFLILLHFRIQRQLSLGTQRNLFLIALPTESGLARMQSLHIGIPLPLLFSLVLLHYLLHLFSDFRFELFYGLFYVLSAMPVTRMGLVFHPSQHQHLVQLLFIFLFAGRDGFLYLEFVLAGFYLASSSLSVLASWLFLDFPAVSLSNFISYFTQRDTEIILIVQCPKLLHYQILTRSLPQFLFILLFLSTVNINEIPFEWLARRSVMVQLFLVYLSFKFIVSLSPQLVGAALGLTSNLQLGQPQVLGGVVIRMHLLQARIIGRLQKHPFHELFPVEDLARSPCILSIAITRLLKQGNGLLIRDQFSEIIQPVNFFQIFNLRKPILVHQFLLQKGEAFALVFLLAVCRINRETFEDIFDVGGGLVTAVEAIFEPITLLFLFLPVFLFFRSVPTGHIEYILQLAVDNLLLPLPVGVEDSEVPAVDNHGHLQVILVVFAQLGHLDDPLAAREVPGQVLVLVVEFVIDRCDLLPRGDLVGVAAVLLRCVQDALHQLQVEVFALVAVFFYQQGLAAAQACHQGRAFL